MCEFISNLNEHAVRVWIWVTEVIILSQNMQHRLYQAWKSISFSTLLSKNILDIVQFPDDFCNGWKIVNEKTVLWVVIDSDFPSCVNREFTLACFDVCLWCSSLITVLPDRQVFQGLQWSGMKGMQNKRSKVGNKTREKKWAIKRS